jgi:hypothetical protein
MRFSGGLALVVLFLGAAARAQDATPTAQPSLSAPVALPDAAEEAAEADRVKAATNPVPQAPVFTGSNITTKAPPRELLVFTGTILLNEFVYRAVLGVPKDAIAVPETARLVAEKLAKFLGDAGYDLAKVRAQVKGDQIEVQVDEGALDKIVVMGAGWLTALRFRAALDLPLNVFNRRLFEAQMPKLAKDFGFSDFKYEVWPVHLLAADNGVALEGIEELRAMPIVQARAYELRVLTHGDPWGTGFSPEVLLDGSIGLGVGGRYRLKDVFQQGDRWQAHFRLGGTLRSSLDPDGGTSPVNTLDYLTTRWLSRAWGGSERGLRFTIVPRYELWSMQRSDLSLDSFRIQTLELGAGAGSQLFPTFSLFFTGGFQRRWIFDVKPETLVPVASDVSSVPGVQNRAFLRANSTYTFNPGELRQDERDSVSLELTAVRPTAPANSGFFRFDAQGHKLFNLGWNELRVGLHYGGELGTIDYPDEISLDGFLRVGFGLNKHTHRAGTGSLELRYSILRDKFKVGLFNDLGFWRHLPRDDSSESSELAGSAGGGLFFLFYDQLQVDAYYGVGWSADGYKNAGLVLAIKEAF